MLHLAASLSITLKYQCYDRIKQTKTYSLKIRHENNTKIHEYHKNEDSALDVWMKLPSFLETLKDYGRTFFLGLLTYFTLRGDFGNQ